MKYVRLILVLMLSGVFLFLAYFLYEKQHYKYSFLSFELNSVNHSLVVPNLDRFLKKLNGASSVEHIGENQTLLSGLDELILHKNTGLNENLGNECFVSFNQTDFVLAFSNPDLTYEVIEEMLSGIFNVSGTYTDGKFQLGGINYETGQYGIYTVFSSLPIDPTYSERTYTPTNADYFVLSDSVSIDRFILTNGQQFKVWNESADPVRGKPVIHNPFIDKVPGSFDDVYFYGSYRLQEDKATFFDNPGEEEFSWIGNGMVILKKDSFELVLAPQNDQRDLKLILEEQTLTAQGDSGQVNYFSVKNFEIMPFKTAFKWQESVNEIDTELAYYTEYEDFNVLANSISAMRWYLSEIQTGNLIEEDENLRTYYTLSTPQKSHYLHINRQGDEILFESGIWANKNRRTNTSTLANLSGNMQEGNSSLAEFIIPFDPKGILPVDVDGTTKLLLYTNEKMVLYDLEGMQEWEVIYPSPMVSSPELIDLENNGKPEIALFLKNGFSVYDINGAALVPPSVNFNQAINGGLIVNYDQGYDYRFFIHEGQAISCYNETGTKVEGWTFSQSNAPLANRSSYVQIGGKDYLTFRNTAGGLHVLNRRGEERFPVQHQLNVKNPSDFPVGKDEATLRFLGYENQYIYNYYLRDGHVDSLKLDKRVNAVSAEWVMLKEPTLVIEEPGRIILFNAFGYVEQEILKPQNATTFVGIETIPDIHYVFFDNSNNSLYLLNRDGKTKLTNPSRDSNVYGITATRFYTFDGQKITEHKLN